jgi:AraC-like DNA-binding protein
MPASTVEFEIRTPRADDFERDVSPLLGAHRLQLQGRGAPNAFYLRHKALPRMSLSTVRYGREVGVEVLAERAHWSVSKVAAGCVSVGAGAGASRHHPGSWTVYAPDCADALSFDASGEVQTLALPLASLDAALAALLGHPLPAPLQLPHGWRSTPQQARRLDQIAARLWALDEDGAGLPDPVWRLHEELALYELLLTLPHGHSTLLQRASQPPGALPVRRAREFLHAHLDAGGRGDLALANVAAHAGLGVRALGEAFKRELGVTPMRYLRQLRLDRARLDLLAGRCSVTEAAMRWGFWNLGDFARYYRERHGELPRAARAAAIRPSPADDRVFPTKAPP